MKAPEIIETERLSLRRLVMADAQAVFDMNAHPDVVRHMTRTPSTEMADTVGFLERCQRVWDEGDAFTWAITLEGGVVGTIEARNSRHGVELGYLLDRSVWGNGYMLEAAHAVTEWAMGDPTVFRVWAFTNVGNTASQNVLEGLGMTREGRLHRWVPQPNVAPTPADAYIYALWR